MAKTVPASVWPAVIALAIGTAYLIALLAAEKQALIIALLVTGIAAVIAAAWLGLLDSVTGSFADHENEERGCEKHAGNDIRQRKPKERVTMVEKHQRTDQECHDSAAC